MAMLNDLAEVVSDSDDLESFARPLLRMLEQVTGLEATYLTEIDEQQGVQSVLYVEGEKENFITEGIQVPWDDTLCKRAIDEQVFFTQAVGERWPESGAAKELGIQTFLSHPVCLGDGSLYGTLCGASHASVTVNTDARKILQLFAELIARQIDRERLLKQLQNENRTYKHFALTDPLTGVPNRRAAVIELSRALLHVQRHGGVLHLAFLDLDGFKAINDTYGHDAGDRFLLELSATFTHGMRQSDYFARIGGDEFLAFSLETDSSVSKETEHSQSFADRLFQLSKGVFNTGEHMLDYQGASVGVVSTTTGEETAEVLIQRADDAMYKVKQARKKRL